VTASAQIQSQLDSFGIDTQTSISSSYAQYLKDLKAQKIAFGWWIGTSLTPYGIMSRLFGAPNGYQTQGGKLFYYPPSVTDQGNWLAFPQSVKVNGYGSVKVGPMTNSLNSVTGKAKTNKIMQTLMFTANEYVPEITMWNYSQVGFVNDKNFTNFPLKNMLVMRSCSGEYPPIGCWNILGYVKPR